MSIPVTVTSAPDASGMTNWRLSVFRPTLPTGLAPGEMLLANSTGSGWVCHEPDEG
jgi:hypothetical protein